MNPNDAMFILYIYYTYIVTRIVHFLLWRDVKEEQIFMDFC